MRIYPEISRWNVTAIPLAIVLALSVFLLSPGAKSTQAQSAVTINIVDFAFSQGTMTVAAGTTVTWVNQGAATHTATSDTGAFDTGQIAPGQSASITFDTPGTYTYHCANHPNMTATIVVTSAGAAAPTATTAAGGTTQIPSTGSGPGSAGAAIGSIAMLAGLACVLLFLGVAIRRRAA